MPETSWLLASTGRVNKTLVFFTRPICSKNALGVRSRTAGLKTPLIVGMKTENSKPAEWDVLVESRCGSRDDCF